MRYQKTHERRAVILMVVLALLTLFALVGVTFVLYADAEATAARVFREAETAHAADVDPQQALAFFLSQLIYDVPDTAAGAGSGLRGHSLARTMYGYQYPGLNVVPYNGIGRLHYASPISYPTTPLTNVPNNWGGKLDDYAMVNYTWFSGDGFVRDPERYGFRTDPNKPQSNPYVGGNAPYTYPDLNNFFLAAMKADGTVLVPSFHRPWLFQVVNGKYYAFNDMTNPNWTNPQGKYLTLRPRPAEHPLFPPPGDATGDVKNLPWAPGGNDSIWIDLGAPVMTAPDGTPYKMLFAPLIIDLDNRINLNTAGNILAYGTNNSTLPSVPHVSNQGWGGWEVNLGKVLYGNTSQGTATQNSPVITVPSTLTMNAGDYVTVYSGTNVLTTTIASITGPTSFNLTVPWPYASGPVTVIDQEWVNLFTGKAQLSGQIVPGKYKANGGGSYTPSTPGATIPLSPSAISLITTLQHSYAQSDINGLNETSFATPPVTSSGRPLPPGFPANPLTGDPVANPAVNPFASFQQGYTNGGTENINHPLLFNVFQTPLTSSIGPRAFRASDMEALLRPNASISGSVYANLSTIPSDLPRLCPTNFSPETLPTWSTMTVPQKTAAMRFRNLVTTQSWDIGSPGVTPYWWQGMTTGYLATNTANSYLLPPVASQPAQGTAQGFPPLPPTAGVTNLPGTIPITSEFGPDWRALSAISGEYLPTTNPAGYVSPGARIRLNRPLPPYPHMGKGLMPPYTSLPPGKTLSPYGVAYDLTNSAILNQYNAAQNARQALANDIYRRLLAIAGLPKPANPASPTNVELAPRRWLAQLAVNIVDYIDEDDIMTPFNFYTTQDNNGAALAPPASTVTTQPTTQGPDDPTPTGANPDYWVFGTELPKVVLNEVLAEAQQLDTTQAAQNGESVKLWIELYNTMPATGGTNTQPQDQWRVPLYISLPGGSGGYSPYRISISQYTMEQANSPANAPGTTAQVPDDSANVLGKAYIAGPFPQSTTDADFSGVVQLSQNLANPPPNPPVTQAPFTVPGWGNAVNAGVDPSNYFLIGPKTLPNDNNGNPLYENPFVYSTTSPSLPPNIPVLQTDSVTYTPTWVANPTNPDERTTGLTVMLRRLANPYLPPQLDPTKPNYNPYVTVDYIPSVPIQQSNQSIVSFGKRQPYTGLLKLSGPITYDNKGQAIIPFLSPTDSPVAEQSASATPPPPMGTIFITNNVSNTFGRTNYPLPPSTHYDWLVHLDRPPISPMELLHVSAWPPYKLTQKFMLGDDTVPANLFGHYARWLDSPPVAGIITLGGTATTGSPTITMSNTTGLTVGTPVNVISTTGPTTEEVFSSTISAIVPNTSITLAGNWPYSTGTVTVTTYNYGMACPWWFDPTLPAGSSHRLYRLFEFLECGDRAFGVNGLGRIPGRVNINTIWDAETLQALIDANMSMGIAPNPANTPLNLPGDVVSQIFANMMASRSPSYYNGGTYTNAVPIGPVNMGTGLDDRPFIPLSTGLNLGKASGSLQFPNGLSVTTDTLLRTNNPFAKTPTYPGGATAANNWLLFQNYTDTQLTHPYLQTQLLTKLFNNVTTRSNVFAVFLTVGFFQVIPGGAVGHPNIPQLGPELGASEGKQIRHRMFAIIDRTNLATLTTASATAVTGINGANFTGTQTIQLPLNVTGTGTGATAQLFVPNPNTGVPGVIQAGTQLVIDPGNVNEETITVSAVTPPVGTTTPATLTANFTLPHAAGATIIQRGNPGPWLLTPYDPRLDPNVVLYFNIIE